MKTPAENPRPGHRGSARRGATTACSSSGDAADSDTLSVGVFLPGSVNDTGFMQSGYEGFQRIQATHGDKIEASYVEQAWR